MKIRIDLDDSYSEPEVVIKTNRLSPEIEALRAQLQELHRPPLIFYKERNEFFLRLEDLLFFETDGSKIFAHTPSDAYEVKLKLYELETYLPSHFCRIAKSTIVNSRAIYSLEKSFSGTSRVSFYETHKQVYVSRHYYHLLKEKLNEIR